jgi:hypothetical protein
MTSRPSSADHLPRNHRLEAGTLLKMDPPGMAEAGGNGQFFRAADGAGTKVLTPP